jgi:hypothetical protein
MILAPIINFEILANISLFLIFFALISWILRKSKFFSDSKGIQIIISASSAFLALYGLIKTNFSIENLMFRYNLSETLQYNFFLLISIILISILWIKFKTGRMLIALGLFLTLIGFLNIFYINSTLVTIIGLIFLGVGIILIRKNSFKKKFKSMNLKDQLDYKMKKRQL